MASTTQNEAIRDIAKGADKIGKDAAGVGSDIADKAGDIANAARDAIGEMRRIIDDFAARTGTATTEAAGSVKSAGVDAGRQVSQMLNSAEAFGRSGVDSVAETISKRPLTSLAVAVGVGVLLGLSRRDASHR